MFLKCTRLTFIALLWNLPTVFADPISGLLGLLGASGGDLGGAGASGIEGLLGGSGGGLGGAGAGASGIGGAAGGLGSAGGAAAGVAPQADSFFGFAQNGLTLLGQGVKIANDIAQSPWFPPLLNSALDYQKQAQQQLYANNPLLEAYEPLGPKPKSTDGDSADGELGGSVESPDQDTFSGVDSAVDSSDPFKLLRHGSNAFRVPKLSTFHLNTPDGTAAKESTEDVQFSHVPTPDPLALSPPLHPNPYSSLLGGASDGDDSLSTPKPTEKPEDFNIDSDYIDSLALSPPLHPDPYSSLLGGASGGDDSLSTPKPTEKPEDFNIDSDYIDSFFEEEHQGESSASEKESASNISVAKATPDPFNFLHGSASAGGQPFPLLPPLAPSVLPGHPHPFLSMFPGFQAVHRGLPPSSPQTTKEDAQNPPISDVDSAIFKEHRGSSANLSGIIGDGGKLTKTNRTVNLNATLPTATGDDGVGIESASIDRIFNSTANFSRSLKSGLRRPTKAPNSPASTTEAAVDDSADWATLIESNETVPPIATRAPLRRVFILPRRRLLRLNSIRTKRPVLTKVADTDFRQ